MVGTSIYRRFNEHGVGYKVSNDDGSSNDLVAHGIVKSFRPEKGSHRWRILYDDKYIEDFDIAELIEFGINKKSSNPSTSPTTGSMVLTDAPEINNNPWVEIKPARRRKGESITDAPADRNALMDDMSSALKSDGC